jgi:CheY-like chemotaxis protein
VLLPLDDREAFAGHVAVVRALLEPDAVLVPLIVLTATAAPIFDGPEGLELSKWTSRVLAGAKLFQEPVISRSGLSPAAEIVQMAQSGNFDLIALGWTQQLGPGHDQAVRQVLATATTPVLLLPLEPAGVSRAPALGPQHVVDRWGEPVEILLVEDDPAHVRLTQEALDEIGLVNALHVVDTGEAALAFIHRECPYADAPQPGLILMAVYLPGRSGLEVLREIKADPDLQEISVAVLTTSEEGQDVQEAYRLGATCFITKPVRDAAFVAAVRDLGRFWFTTVTPPRSGAGAAVPPRLATLGR